MSPDPLLEVRDLRTYLFSSDGERVVRAVDGISFSVSRGTTLGIVGESGCGKSMTTTSIMRLLPKGGKIVGGDIRFDNESLLGKSEAEMRRIRGRRIAIILQDPMVSLDPLYTVGDQLAEPLRVHKGMEGRELHERCIGLLKAVGIPSPELRMRQHPHEMSGGMLQRIVGAIAISCNPELLIADEPTTALDPTIQLQFLDVLIELRDRNGLAMIVVTHDFGVAAYLCNHIMVMYAGRVAERGSKAQIFENPQHPYTQALLASTPAGGHVRGRRLRTIDGQPPNLASLPPGCPFAPRCPEAVARCWGEAPAPVEIEPGHVVACWRRDAA